MRSLDTSPTSMTLSVFAACQAEGTKVRNIGQKHCSTRGTQRAVHRAKEVPLLMKGMVKGLLTWYSYSKG